MATKSEKIREELERDVAELRTLRDEIGVKLHLASMDVKSAWQELEPKFDKLQQTVTSQGESDAEAGVQLAKDLKKAFVEFRERL